jgi:hypothetical protein
MATAELKAPTKRTHRQLTEKYADSQQALADVQKLHEDIYCLAGVRHPNYVDRLSGSMLRGEPVREDLVPLLVRLAERKRAMLAGAILRNQIVDSASVLFPWIDEQFEEVRREALNILSRRREWDARLERLRDAIAAARFESTKYREHDGEGTAEDCPEVVRLEEKARVVQAELDKCEAENGVVQRRMTEIHAKKFEADPQP